MNIFKRIKYFFMWHKAIRMADDAHYSTGIRYYVMPSTDGKLMVIDRRNFRLLKKKGYISSLATVGHMTAECFYHTGYANGTHCIHSDVLKLKRKQYWQWAQRFASK